MKNTAHVTKDAEHDPFDSTSYRDCIRNATDKPTGLQQAMEKVHTSTDKKVVPTAATEMA
jgi:hypothetical protein